MAPTNHDWSSDTSPVLGTPAIRESAWRMAAGMLLALSVINVGAVMLTASTFSALFMITTFINVVLALALRQMKPWGRILTLARSLLGIALAVAIAATQGAYLDALVTTLLLAGIAMPILGPPHRLKSLIGVGLFMLGSAATVGALLSSLVAVN